ncbi:MAG TPA: hypothetical protein VFU07_05420 [Candidatus Lumbricidophila sp.]|nr:hypothetical protein [Candidatus Lumbricidophila sp.]
MNVTPPYGVNTQSVQALFAGLVSLPSTDTAELRLARASAWQLMLRQGRANDFYNACDELERVISPNSHLKPADLQDALVAVISQDLIPRETFLILTTAVRAAGVNLDIPHQEPDS